MRGKNRLPRRAGRNSLEFCSLAAKRFVTAEPTFDHERLGHEPQRGNLKYRCPAQYEGWECPMSERCNAGKQYGLTVRAPREIDLRRFPALPRATPKFERLYKRRPAVERVNARLKIFWGADDGNVTGSPWRGTSPSIADHHGHPRPVALTLPGASRTIGQTPALTRSFSSLSAPPKQGGYRHRTRQSDRREFFGGKPKHIGRVGAEKFSAGQSLQCPVGRKGRKNAHQAKPCRPPGRSDAGEARDTHRMSPAGHRSNTGTRTAPRPRDPGGARKAGVSPRGRRADRRAVWMIPPQVAHVSRSLT